MPHATIHILDEVNIIVRGLEQTALNDLKNKFAVYAKGYRHQPKYKLGVWDGKINFFKVKMLSGNQTGYSYFKLLPEIIDYLRATDHTISMEDHRKSMEIDIPEIDKDYLRSKGFDISLGDHQVRGVNALTQNNGGIFEGGTGAGKTLMTAVLCHLYADHPKFKCIVIVPTSDLIEQTYLELVEYGVDAGRYSGDNKDVNHTHLVSTWQSLQNNRGLIGQYQTVIVDECHGVTGSVLQEILNENGAECYTRMGLTGTLPEEEIDQMAVRVTLGDVIEKVEAHELIASGWLAMLKLFCYELVEDVRDEYHAFCESNPDEAANLDYSKFKTEFFADYQAEKKYIQKKPERLEFLSKIINAVDQNTLVLVPNVEFGRKISKLIPNSIFFYGQDSKKVRKQIYDAYSDNDDMIAITTYKLASTGLNIKRIFNLFLVDAGKSYVEVIQSIGRGLRKAPDKDKVMVYDIHSDFKYSKRHAAARKRHYKAKKYAHKVKKVQYTAL